MSDGPATHREIDDPANGPAWAAILAAAIGGFAVAVLTDLSEVSPRAAALLQWYRPAGALSGVAGGAVLVWAGTWAALHARWHGRDLRRSTLLLTATCTMVAASIVCTFPPFYQLL